MAKKKPVKDLRPSTSSTVKGGGSNLGNDNITLVRGAKPVKDLAPKKNPRGGAAKKLN